MLIMQSYKDSLLKQRMSAYGRRGTIQITPTDRGKTALGLYGEKRHSLQARSFKQLPVTSPPRRKSDTTSSDSNLPRRKSSSAVSANLRRLSELYSNVQRTESKSDVRFSKNLIITPSSMSLVQRRTSLKFKPSAARRGTLHVLRRESILETGLVKKKTLLAKFRLAVRLAVFCARTFREHCLRINEDHDELAPYIKRLHFQEENPDLLIDLSQFKANRQLRMPDEAIRILSKEVGERSEQELYSVTIALRNNKTFAEFPKRMQRKIAEIALYEKYESKRVIVRQGHPASGFYFILSGAVVVMVMDVESNYARPVAHLYKGQTFGELAIINGTKRNSTVIAKETCEFLSISAQDYHKIFMAGGVKNINDPDQEVFLKGLSFLAEWPIHILQDHPNKCQFLFFKNADVIVQDSHYSDWLIIVKSGSVQVLKKLKKVHAFEWRKKRPPELLSGKAKQELVASRSTWRRCLPEVRIPLQDVDSDDDDIAILDNGHPVPFQHPDDARPPSTASTLSTPRKSQMPTLWPFRIEDEDDDIHAHTHVVELKEFPHHDHVDRRKHKHETKHHHKVPDLRVNPRYRSNSVIEEEKEELLGYQPHIRTFIEDIDDGIKRKDDDEINPADLDPEFVHVQTLTKGQVFGLADIILEHQPSFSVVSKGADCLLINKNFYLDHASEKLLRDMRQELCPYPSEEELQERLQVSVDWQAYRRDTLQRSMQTVVKRRHMRSTVRGTKVQEAY